MYVYIYIYMGVVSGWRGEHCSKRSSTWDTANFRTKILDFGGFDSSGILILRGGIPRPIGNFPKSLSQAILVGIM